jgi:type I protein arginine methyltransferase
LPWDRPMYSIRDYSDMVADRHRTNAYVEALRRSAKPDSLVLDIGAGTGVFSLMACQLGARRVVAIEPDDVIHMAREIATCSGFADRIEFIQALSTDVSLPERADVIVSDLRGVLPLFTGHLKSVADARRRFLSPGGVLIPREDSLWVTLVDAPDVYRDHVGIWQNNDLGLDLGAALRFTTNSWGKVRLKPGQFLVEPKCWAKLDYTTLEGTEAHGEVAWTLPRAGTAHGLCLWFDAELLEGVGFSNAPGSSEQIYGQAFFPLSQPLALDAGDTISVALRADLVGEDYQWTWETRVVGRDEPGRCRTTFRQSTFLGVPRSMDRLKKKHAGHVPTLKEDGQIDRLILERMDGATPLGDIAGEILDRFPSRFSRWEEALGRVGDLSERYGR